MPPLLNALTTADRKARIFLLGARTAAVGAAAIIWGLSAAAQGQPVSTTLGSAHTSGKYYFTDKDFLNEGAATLAEGGFRAIKVWFDEPAKFYPWNSRWPRRFQSYVDMARHPYFRELFNRPFDTYVLTILDDVKSLDGLSDPAMAAIETKTYDLARHLLQTYRGSGKVFILGQHEGDWHLRGTSDLSVEKDPTALAILGMTRWYVARQTAVDRARRDVPDTDVKVYHAPEVNLVHLAREGRPTVTNSILPRIQCDLVSYSCWDSIHPLKTETATRDRFRSALGYLAKMVPPSTAIAPDGRPFGHRNIYIGEYGWPEQEPKPDGSAQMSMATRVTVEEAIRFGCPYAFFWEVYDNECCSPGDVPCKPRPGGHPKAQPARQRELCRGFWLRRADGTYSPAWEDLTARLTPMVPPVHAFEVSLSSSQTAFHLKWPSQPKADRYRIERSDAWGPFHPLEAIPADGGDFEDTSIKVGVSYRYRIRTERDNLRSGWFYCDPIQWSSGTSK